MNVEGNKYKEIALKNYFKK